MAKTQYQIDREKLRNQKRWAVEKESKRLVTIAKKENQRMREYGVTEWFSKVKPYGFGLDTYNNMLKSTVYDYESRWQNDSMIITTLSSGISLMKYSEPESLSRQSDLYQEIDDDSYYVLMLQWEQGIVGLPKYFSYKTINGVRQKVRPYENPYYFSHSRSLKDSVFGSYRYRWNANIQKLYQSKWRS